jgi:hypothetical protein
MKLVRNLKAFPSSEVCSPNDDGMTMLDYFAAKALIGVLYYSRKHETYKNIAEQSYAIAEAMLEESDKYER